MQYTKAKLNKLKKAKNNITTVTNQSHFRKLYTDLEGKDLNPTQLVMLTYIYNTMELSWTHNDQYYDDKRHNYYAVVTRAKMDELYNIKGTAAGENLQFLEDAGYIKKVQEWKGGVRVFVRRFNYVPKDKTENVEKRSRNPLPSYIHDSYIQSTSDTEHTARVSELNNDDKIKKMIENGIQAGINKVMGKNKSNEPEEDKTIEDGQDDKHLNYVVSNTGSMPAKAINSIGIMADNLYRSPKKKRKFIFDINGLVFKHKHRVAEDNGLLNSFYWEKDNLLLTKFNASIYEFLYNAFSGKRKVENSFAYFAGSLKKLFKGIADEELGRTPENPKQQGRKHIQEKEPYWEKSGYRAPKDKEDKINNTRKQELQAKLAKINGNK